MVTTYINLEIFGGIILWISFGLPLRFSKPSNNNDAKQQPFSEHVNMLLWPQKDIEKRPFFVRYSFSRVKEIERERVFGFGCQLLYILCVCAYVYV